MFIWFSLVSLKLVLGMKRTKTPITFCVYVCKWRCRMIWFTQLDQTIKKLLVKNKKSLMSVTETNYRKKIAQEMASGGVSREGKWKTFDGENKTIYSDRRHHGDQVNELYDGWTVWNRKYRLNQHSHLRQPHQNLVTSHQHREWREVVSGNSRPSIEIFEQFFKFAYNLPVDSIAKDSTQSSLSMQINSKIFVITVMKGILHGRYLSLNGTEIKSSALVLPLPKVCG